MSRAKKPEGRLGIVRHGQTQANIDKVWHGHTDTALTSLGVQQARKLGSYFRHYMHPEVIVSSPLQRARITATHIADAFSLSVQLDKRLMEFNLGDWEGVPFASLQNDSDIMEKLLNEPGFTAPNGESQLTVKARVVQAIEEICAANHGKNVVIVAHGVSLAIALSHYLEEDTRCWAKYSKSNTAFSELCIQNKALLSFNRTDHLK